MKKQKYFNFPVQLLEGFMVDSKKVLDNICDFAVYKNSLNYDEDSELQNIEQSLNFFHVVAPSLLEALNSGKLLHDSIPENSPYAGLSLQIFWDFYKNDKTEFDKACLLGFLGIRSILGSKGYCKVTNLYWLSRMDGKPTQVTYYLELSDAVRKYSTEYQTKKIKTALRNGWGLVTYSWYCRGFFVSFKITLKELILEVEKRRISIKEKQYKKVEKETLKEVLEQLKGSL
jgi:hypothetical protein